MSRETENHDAPLRELQAILINPIHKAKGKTFISDVEYAIYLIEKHRKEQAQLIAKIN